jgi:hypothetical protein
VNILSPWSCDSYMWIQVTLSHCRYMHVKCSAILWSQAKVQFNNCVGAKNIILGKYSERSKHYTAGCLYFMYLLRECSKHVSYQELSAVKYSRGPLNYSYYILLCLKVKSIQFCFRRNIAIYAWLRPQKKNIF